MVETDGLRTSCVRAPHRQGVTPVGAQGRCCGCGGVSEWSAPNQCPELHVVLTEFEV